MNRRIVIVSLIGLLMTAGCGSGGDGATIQDLDVIVDSDLGMSADLVVVDVPLEQVEADVQASDVQGTCPALDTCRVAHCAGTTEAIALRICLIEQCRADYETCFGSFGTGTCEDSYLCAQACTAGDDACAQNCIDGATYEASLAFLQLTGCMHGQCAAQMASDKVASLQQCILASCKTEFEGCNGTFEDDDCTTLLKCEQACGSNSDDCALGCMVASSYDANIQFIDLGVCMEEYCPEALENPMENISCFVGDCSAPINACCGSLMGCL